ncbi:hypothetical protein PVAP13_3KG261481 [Panicum virgatum]|uniref:Uncharacterized protein n=1 Tax=Panicum virgatum TaxID=38727 RepID=A0A8T0UZK7_PANVG|nr:hypothetical protein PVAP13_3KG261481 [Panicum virgatum]
MVGDEAVWGEELREFATYCQDSLGCRKKIVCHMCVFDQHNYFGKLHAPSNMLVHCSSKHTIGYKCPKSGCMVRVATPRELPLHIHFYHELPTGWWEMTPYNEKMNVMKGD